MQRCFFCFLLLIANMSYAELEIGTGASCFSIVSALQRDWLSVKRYLIPGTETLDRADDEHFVCVSRYSVQGALERQSLALSDIRCFRDPRSQIGFCCDSRISECAMLNPGLFPEAYQQRRREREYEPPKSDWVRPPTESEQWQNN